MKDNAGVGCIVLVVLIVLGAALLRLLVLHPGPALLIGIAVCACVVLATHYGKRSERERSLRRAGASLRVEAARTGAERRMRLAQEFMRVAGQALDAVPPEAEPGSWSTLLDDLLAESEQLERSALDPQAARLPDPRPRDPLDAATLIEALVALCSFLRAAQMAAPKDWRERPERLRVARRERTRLLVAQDTVAQRVQQ